MASHGGEFWRKSTRSGPNANCVEVALEPGAVHVRHSRDPAGPRLTFVAAEWAAFLRAVRAGVLDT